MTDPKHPHELRVTDSHVHSLAAHYLKPEHVEPALAHFAGALNEHLTPEEQAALSHEDVADAFETYARLVPESAKPATRLTSGEMKKKYGASW